jgi:hypothetical protein
LPFSTIAYIIIASPIGGAILHFTAESWKIQENIGGMEMIRSLNQQAFRVYGTILTEKTRNQRYANRHSISLRADTTSLYQSAADTWLT